MEHEMLYRAGSEGFASVGIPDGPPHWYCRCGGWSFIARPNVTRKTGNNSIEAQRAFASHEVRSLHGEVNADGARTTVTREGGSFVWACTCRERKGDYASQVEADDAASTHLLTEHSGKH